MSTRCQIGIYRSKDTSIDQPEVLLYRHCDGYPKGVLPDMKEFLNWWHKGRGISDTEYTGARLIQFMCNQADKQSEEFKASMSLNNQSEKGLTGEIGYGICKEFHGDIEFFYKIYPNAIEVYRTPYDAKPIDFELIETVTLE